jgi:hypothetical protein
MQRMRDAFLICFAVSCGIISVASARCDAASATQVNSVISIRSVRTLVATATVLGYARAPAGRSSPDELASRIRHHDESLVGRLTADGGSYLDDQRLWYVHGASPSAVRLQLAQTAFGLKAREVRFGDAQERRDVAGWLGGAVMHYAPLNGFTKLVLADRTKISIGWQTPFDASATGREMFHGLSGDNSVPFLKRTGTFSIAEMNEGVLVQLPLKAGLSMWVYEPRSSQALAAGYGWTRKARALMTSSRLVSDVFDLRIPKFSVDAVSSVAETARRDEAAPDLGITEVLTIVPPLTAVLQVAQFAVTEHGISMSATTVGYQRKKAQRLPRSIVVDRPFGFLVRDDVTGELFMAGSIVQL